MKGSAQGFTIIEILIAISMLAVISLAVMGMMLSNMRLSAKVRNEQTVAAAARKYMEDAKTLWTLQPGATSTETATVTTAYQTASLPAAPTGLPSGVTCTPAVAPNTNIVGLTTPPTFRSRVVTLSCSGGGLSQAFSLEIVEP